MRPMRGDQPSLEELLVGGVGAVGDGLVVEQDGLGALVALTSKYFKYLPNWFSKYSQIFSKYFSHLEQFVSFLPVLHGLLDAFEARFVLDLEVPDERQPQQELRPFQVGLELHEVGRDLSGVRGRRHELGEELLVEDVEQGGLHRHVGVVGLGHLSGTSALKIFL